MVLFTRASAGRWLFSEKVNEDAEMTTALIRSPPVLVSIARSLWTVELPSTVRVTKYMMFVDSSITGVPTMPMLPLKSLYVPQAEPTSVFRVGRPAPLKFRCQRGAPAVSASKAYTVLFTVAMYRTFRVAPPIDSPAAYRGPA